MGITTSELRKGMLVEEYEIHLYKSQLDSWLAKVVTSSGKELAIDTVHAGVKTWKTLDIALKDIQKYCSAAKSVFVTYEGWEFERKNLK